MPPITIQLFGPFSVTSNSATISDFATDKARALLAFLVVENHRPHTRTHLAALLWPDYRDSDALRNLRQTLHRLRAALDGVTPGLFADTFAVTRQSVVVRSGHLVADVLRFEALLDDAGIRASSSAGRDGSWMALMEEAIALYQGEFLASLPVHDTTSFQEWQAVQRERYHQRALLALHELAGACGSLGAYEKMHTYAERQLALEPWREEAHQQVIHALALLGQRSAALNAYERCRRLLAQEMGVEPSDTTQRLYRAILQGDIAPPNQTQSPNPPPVPRAARIPTFYTPILGREREIAEVMGFFTQGRVRLVTLIGAGGVGKTRLAVEVARQAEKQADLFPDGIWFVSLASSDDPAQIASDLASAMGLPGDSQTQPEQQLRNFLREKRALLVLDNFEQLLANPGASLDFLETLLATVPHLHLLVTSREALNLRAEQRYLVGGLPQEAETALSPAAHLFVQAAMRIVPGFSPSAEETAAVERISRLVQGLPLALEIAASWVRLVPPAVIAEEIARSLDFLSSPLRDLPDRHRSVRAVFDHSWRLLSQAEQLLLARSSIFRGGFNLSAALSITQSSVVEIAALLDKSLLRRSTDSRYELHALVRQFSAEKLASLADGGETRQRHTEYYLLLVAQESPGFHGPHPQQTLQTLRAEIDNLRAAWQHAATTGQTALLRQSGEGMAHFFQFANLFAEGEAALSLAADQTQALGERGIEAQMRAYQSDFLVQLGEQGKAKEGLPAALVHAGGPSIQARIQSLLGHVLQLHGEYTEALSWQQEALSHYTLGQPSWELALCHERLGMVHRALGNLDRAVTAFQTALSIDENLNNAIGIARHQTNLGNVYTYRGQYQAGLACFEAALAVHRALGNQIGIAAQLTQIGRVHWELSDFYQAIGCYQEALTLVTPLGDRVALANLQGRIGGVYFEQRQYHQAKAHFEEALRLDRITGNRVGVAMHTGNLGVICWKQEEYDEAERLYREALALCQSVGDQAGIALWLSNLSNLFYDMADYPQALALGEQAEPIFRSLGNKYYLGGRLIWTAQILYALGRYAEARQKNEEGIEITGKLQRRSRLFPGRVLAAKLDWHDGKTEAACAQLLAQLNEAQDDTERAVLRYELWRMTDSRLHAQAALTIFDALYQTVPLAAYRTHIEELRHFLNAQPFAHE